jgi:hypothetical protein
VFVARIIEISTKKRDYFTNNFLPSNSVAGIVEIGTLKPLLQTHSRHITKISKRTPDTSPRRTQWSKTRFLESPEGSETLAQAPEEQHRKEQRHKGRK